MKRLLVMVLMFSLSICLVSTANAFVWTEIGDAGSLPGTAQVISGTGSLASIVGSGGSNEDMYRIYIELGSAFSATTVGGAGWDTQLFLLDSSGFGVYANDDSVGLQSTLPAGHAFSPTTAGYYYLAISSWDRDPISLGGEIFLDLPWSEVHGPDGAGGGSAISGWTGTGGSGDSYTIFLTGVQGTDVIPEPATLSLLGLGLLGLVGLRKKRG